MPDVLYSDVYPFRYQALNLSTNPAWSNVANTYPASIGAPADDQPQVCIQGTSPSGIYMIGTSVTYQISQTNNSVQARFSINGGSTWENFSKETKDSSDVESGIYTFPFVFGGGAYDFVFQGKKELASGTLAVQFMNIWFNRKA